MPERILNVLFGLSVIGWSLVGLRSAEELNAVRMTVTVLNLTVGGLLLRRSTQVEGGSWGQVVASLPAVLVAGWAFSLASDSRWPDLAVGLFVLGGLGACFAFAYLGRSFAVLPAVREVVSRGPYRWIRHPAYAAELIMVLACSWAASPAIWAVLPILLAIPFVVVRIIAEENLLRDQAEYLTYADAVKWRLVPGLW